MVDSGANALLIDLEEAEAARAVVFGLLKEMERGDRPRRRVADLAGVARCRANRSDHLCRGGRDALLSEDLAGLRHDPRRRPEQARKNATFVLWLRWNYARSMGSAIRRQTDVRDDVVSLGRLIDRVWRYPTVFTRTRFVNMQGIDEADMVNGWFDDLAGTGDYVNPEIPAQDMEDLREKTAVVRGWVNKAIAHKDATGRDPPPLSEIHSCIDVIFELFNKYGQLIRGVSTSKDVVMPIWPVVFRTQWIPDDQWSQIQSQIDHLDLGRPQG